MCIALGSPAPERPVNRSRRRPQIGGPHGFFGGETSSLDIQIPLSQPPQKLRALDFQVPQAASSRDLQAPDLRLASVEGTVRDTQATAVVRRLCPRRGLLQRVDDLLIAENGPFSGPLFCLLTWIPQKWAD